MDISVSVFETTIRYLGGLLSAYELSGQKFPALRDKAKEVADKMAYAWVGVSLLISTLSKWS
jgi:mannosyl-oligosaccharide alpha-1,2-mannosidase